MQNASTVSKRHVLLIQVDQSQGRVIEGEVTWMRKGLATQKTRAHRHPMELPEAAKEILCPILDVCVGVCAGTCGLTCACLCVYTWAMCESVCAYAYICMLVSLCVCVQYVRVHM